LVMLGTLSVHRFYLWGLHQCLCQILNCGFPFL
jgi:hypothetical protein